MKNIQAAVTGNPASGVLSLEQVKQHVMETAPNTGKISALQKSVEDVGNRSLQVEGTLAPILKQSDDQLKELKTQSEIVRAAQKLS